MENSQLTPDYKEVQSISRVAIVPEFTCKGHKYILLIKNRSRQEWELPGGGIQAESCLDAGRRELFEETNLPDDSFNFSQIPIAEGRKYAHIFELNYTIVKGGTGKKEVKTTAILARAKVDRLPKLKFEENAEHDDYMYLEIPPEWGDTQRNDYLSMFRQFAYNKLIIEKGFSKKVKKLKMDPEEDRILKSKNQISPISGITLTTYIDAWFADEI